MEESVAGKDAEIKRLTSVINLLTAAYEPIRQKAAVDSNLLTAATDSDPMTATNNLELGIAETEIATGRDPDPEMTKESPEDMDIDKEMAEY